MFDLPEPIKARAAVIRAHIGTMIIVGAFGAVLGFGGAGFLYQRDITAAQVHIDYLRDRLDNPPPKPTRLPSAPIVGSFGLPYRIDWQRTGVLVGSVVLVVAIVAFLLPIRWRRSPEPPPRPQHDASRPPSPQPATDHVPGAREPANEVLGNSTTPIPTSPVRALVNPPRKIPKKSEEKPSPEFIKYVFVYFCEHDTISAAEFPPDIPPSVALIRSTGISLSSHWRISIPLSGGSSRWSYEINVLGGSGGLFAEMVNFSSSGLNFRVTKGLIFGPSDGEIIVLFRNNVSREI